MDKLRRFVRWAGEHPLLCAAVFFALAVVAHLLCNSLAGPLKLRIMPDEYRFLHITRSIADGGPLLVLGDPTNYQKILYPLLISPAFLLTRDPLAQMKLVEVINILIMSSAVFPAALLAGKLTRKPAVLLFVLAFTVTLPDFMFTATLMGEVLYWPLSIWVFYFFHRAMAEREGPGRLLWFALLGLMIYLAYLTKEVAAAYLITAAAVLAIEGIRDRQRLKQNALGLTLCVSAFFAAFLALKLTLFRDMGNTYDGSMTPNNQFELSALKAPGAFGYLFFSAATLLLAALLSFYVLPVFLPLFGLGAMDREKRRMYLYCVISLVVMIGTIAYTISIREDLGDPVPRWHLRYLAPLAIPFMILCFDFLLSGDKIKQKRNKMPILIPVALLGGLLMVLLPTIPTREIPAVDHASLTATDLVTMFFCMGMDPSAANGVWIAFKLLMLAVTAAGVICLLKGRKKAILAILLCTISVVSIFDNFMCYQTIRLSKYPMTTKSYIAMRMEERGPGEYAACARDLFFSGGILRSSSRLAAAAAAVSVYTQQLDGTVLRCSPYLGYRYLDTYVSQKTRINYIFSDIMPDFLEEGTREHVFDEHDSTKGQRMDYIIIAEEYNPFTNVEVVYEQPPFRVLKNLDPTRLSFK